MPLLPSGHFRHRVTLENPTDVPDAEGGYTTTWARLGPSTHAAVIRPATARDLERVVANTVQTTASHLVTIWYVAGVTTATRVIFHDTIGDRTFSVTGVQDEDERHIQLTLACVE
jgi:SPP1 family predicted phage head-tail adaptor